MKVKVLNKFRDKYDHVTTYTPGMILDVKDEARAKDLTDRGLVKEFKGNQKATAVLETVEADGAAEPAKEAEGSDNV